MNSKDLRSEVNREKEIRNKLATYKRVLTTSFGRSQKDVYEIFGLITKHKKYQKKIYNEIFEDKKNNFSNKVEEISPDQVGIITENLDKIEEQSKKFRSKYKNIQNHPWFGFAANRLSPYEKKELLKNLNKLNGLFKKYQTFTNFKKFKNIKEIGEISDLQGFKNFIIKFADIKGISDILENLKNINSFKDIEKLDNFVLKPKTLLKNLGDENEINKLFHLKKNKFYKG